MLTFTYHDHFQLLIGRWIVKWNTFLFTWY